MGSVFIVLGFIVGFVIGATGMGGGAILTPLLILLGIPPISAVGTGLVYSALTKFFAFIFHKNKGAVNYYILKDLIPYALFGLIFGWYILNSLLKKWDYGHVNKMISIALASLLIITGILTSLSSLRECI